MEQQSHLAETPEREREREICVSEIITDYDGVPSPTYAYTVSKYSLLCTNE